MSGHGVCSPVVRILLVEDEPLIASFVGRGLRAEGYATSVAANGDEAVAELRARDWDLVILDLMLPGLDGFAVLAESLEVDPQPPVLVLSAQNAVATKVAALNAGASDYLAKPFSFDELLARVRVCLRRRPRNGPPETAGQLVQLDARNRRLTRRNGQHVQLSERECALLEYLLQTPREVVSRERILNAVWDYQFDPRSNVVDVYVARLRRKLETEAVIETVRGGGYRLVPF
jgi:two-component system, OmpR family, copper resistance phosphate regulon response regulator CusR